MSSETQSDASPVVTNLFTANDIHEILRERGWLRADAVTTPELLAWYERAAGMLGPHAADRAALVEMLGLIFHYDAAEIFKRVECHVVLSRYGARDVLRRLALALLDGGPLTSDGFSAIIDDLKNTLDLNFRELFHPIRLFLAGREGEGELDRVILLIDSAAALPFSVPVKSNQVRVLEFCSSLD
jgi:hypothetical protein